MNAKLLHMEETVKLKLDPVKKLFKGAFAFYIDRFWKLTVIILLPFISLVFIIPATFVLKGSSFFILVAVVFFLMFFLFGSLAGIALIFAVIKDDLGVFAAYKTALSNIFSFLWIGFLASLIIFGGFLMGIIPGIIFSVRFSFFPYLLVDQGQKGFNALLKSKEYVKGYWWPVFSRISVLLLFQILVNIFVFIVVSLVINKEVGDLARNIANFILTPFYIVYFYHLYKNFVALKPEVAAAPVYGKKGFFVFSAVLGILFLIIIIASLLFIFTLVGLQKIRNSAPQSFQLKQSTSTSGFIQTKIPTLPKPTTKK